MNSNDKIKTAIQINGVNENEATFSIHLENVPIKNVLLITEYPEKVVEQYIATIEASVNKGISEENKQAIRKTLLHI